MAGNKNMRGKIVWIAFVLLMFLFNFIVFLAPYLAIIGEDEFSSAIYSFFILFDHQWPYRSLCIYDEGFFIGECIPRGFEDKVWLETRYTDWESDYDGNFEYNKNQVGLNRADVIILNEREGYKIPVCARDVGFYLGMFLGALLYFRFFKKGDEFPFVFILIVAAPIGVDGFLQLLTDYESLNLMRGAAGFASGYLTSTMIVGNFISKVFEK